MTGDPEDTKGAAGPPSKSSSALRQSKSLEPSDVVGSLGAGASDDSGAGWVVASGDVGESCGASIGDAALGAGSAVVSGVCSASVQGVDSGVSFSGVVLSIGSAGCVAGVCSACGESALVMRVRANSSVGAC